MASFKNCTDFPFYAIYLYFNKIELRNYKITAMDYKNHTRQSLNLLACWWAQPFFFSKLSLKIVLCNGALHVRHTDEAWWGTNRPRRAEWYVRWMFPELSRKVPRSCDCSILPYKDYLVQRPIRIQETNTYKNRGVKSFMDYVYESVHCIDFLKLYCDVSYACNLCIV